MDFYVINCQLIVGVVSGWFGIVSGWADIVSGCGFKVRLSTASPLLRKVQFSQESWCSKSSKYLKAYFIIQCLLNWHMRVVCVCVWVCVLAYEGCACVCAFADLFFSLCFFGFESFSWRVFGLQCVCLSVSKCLCLCMCSWTCICRYTCVCVVWVWICMCVNVFVCKCVCVFIGVMESL